ncbi:MAG TPA: hypothetical protein VHM90_09930 [Phycisphaerae bacterium]|nr:hypothetical protein [Phycisphaerae bacterium]
MTHRAITPLLHAGLLGSLGLLLFAVSWWNFRIVHEEEFLRTNVLVAEIVAGVGAAVCFGGGIHFINVARAMPLRCFARLPLWVKVRVLMVMQMGAMVIVIGALYCVVFDKRIPGPDYSYLYRGWAPPAPDVQPVER